MHALDTDRPGSEAMVLLGATGDLTARYLLPALAQLRRLGELDDSFRLIAVSDQDISIEEFRETIARSLQAAGGFDHETIEQLCAQTSYLAGDVTDHEVLQRALDQAQRADPSAIAMYLALPHVLFRPVIEALGRCSRPESLRIVVEKPFGEDLAGAKVLNAALSQVATEDRIFRVDHFLAKQTVLNLLGLRFANRVLEPLWNRDHIQSVDIVFDETVDAQSRASYYDKSGALRDMIQNHLLQILAYVTMEPPLTIEASDISARKVDALRAVRTMSRDEVATGTVRARYTAGEVTDETGTRHVGSYGQAPGVDPSRGTETFAEVTCYLDNWRWSGVPFRLRTGKALASRRREVVVRFRPAPQQLFGESVAEPNELRLQMDPDRMSLQLNVNGPGDPFDLEAAALDAELAKQEPSPYGQLIRAILDGDTRLSAHAEEAEQGWRITEPILARWEADQAPLLEYPAGSSGPTPPTQGIDIRGRGIPATP